VLNDSNPLGEQKLEMPKKSKLVVLLIAGFVAVFVVLVLSIPSSPSGDPVKVTLMSYTNESAVISIKNQTSAALNFSARVERKIDGEWPEWPIGLSLPGSLDPFQQTNLTMTVLVDVPLNPWRVSFFSVRKHAPVKIGRIRNRLGLWCWDHGLLNLSQKLLGEGDRPFQLSMPEMAQESSSVTKN
jgi:hypothetical protein